MRQILFVLALAALALALQKDLLVFQEVESPYKVNGTFLLYMYQPVCEECKMLEALFSDKEVVALMSKYSLYALDLSRAHISGTLSVAAGVYFLGLCL